MRPLMSEERPTLREARLAFERAYVHDVLQRYRGNVTCAAQEAGVGRGDFYRLMQRLSIERPKGKLVLKGRQWVRDDYPASP